MKRIAGLLLLFLLATTPLLAAPAFPLESLLKRAKRVYIGEVTEFREGKVSLKATTLLRGDHAASTPTFTFVDIAGIKPEKGHRYFVFSQEDDARGKAKDVIQISQGMDGQISYLGWIMLPIDKMDNREIVNYAYSFKLRKVEEAFKQPLTLDEAKQLVKDSPNVKSGR